MNAALKTNLVMMGPYSSVDSSELRVRIPATPSKLFPLTVKYLSLKRTNLYKKKPGLAHIKILRNQFASNLLSCHCSFLIDQCSYNKKLWVFYIVNTNLYNQQNQCEKKKVVSRSKHFLLFKMAELV